MVGGCSIFLKSNVGAASQVENTRAAESIQGCAGIVIYGPE